MPILGFVKSSHPCNLTVYSLKTETAIHVWRFGSPIIKFKSSIKNPSNKAVVLLREGLLQVINLKSMSQEVIIPTHFIQSNLLNKPRTEIDLNLVSNNLPKNFDCCLTLYAYIHKQIN